MNAKKPNSMLNEFVWVRTDDDRMMEEGLVLEMIISVWIWKSRGKEFAGGLQWGTVREMDCEEKQHRQV